MGMALRCGRCKFSLGNFFPLSLSASLSSMDADVALMMMDAAWKWMKRWRIHFSASFCLPALWEEFLLRFKKKAGGRKSDIYLGNRVSSLTAKQAISFNLVGKGLCSHFLRYYAPPQPNTTLTKRKKKKKPPPQKIASGRRRRKRRRRRRKRPAVTIHPTAKSSEEKGEQICSAQPPLSLLFR